MTESLTQPRPRLYKAISVAAVLIASLALLFAGYILLAVLTGGRNAEPALMLLIFPAVMLFGAAKLWAFGRVIRITDRTRAEEIAKGKRLTRTDFAVFGIAAIWAIMQIRSETPFGGTVGLDLGGVLYALPFLLAPAGVGLIMYNRSRSTPLMSERTTGLLIVGAGLAAMTAVYLYVRLWPSVQQIPGS